MQAGLLHNPVFAASFRVPDRPPNGTDTELSVEQDFLDLLVIPLRRKVAAAELEHAKLYVADHVVQLAADVKMAVSTIQARRTLLDRLPRSPSQIRPRPEFRGGNTRPERQPAGAGEPGCGRACGWKFPSRSSSSKPIASR